MKNKKTVVFAGGGTGGHIFPGLAVADELRKKSIENNISLDIYWIGSTASDRNIVENTVNENGIRSADFFYSIPSGKLRRYFSLQNLFDVFKIIAGFFASIFILLKIKPLFLFSKGGFVSVPPCFAARLLCIPVFTHECDFTPGLATKINSFSATKIFLSYEETKKYFKSSFYDKIIITGNPIRPMFYTASSKKGIDFLGLQKNRLPILLVLGGSSGALQINNLIQDNIDWLCDKFFVIHQTGIKNTNSISHKNYKQFPFIYEKMCDVIAASDIVLSRSGANSIWECATLEKPLVLIPLCGASTRGDQEDNAAFFEKNGAAYVLSKDNANSEKLREVLSFLTSITTRRKMSACCHNMTFGKKPAEKIAQILYNVLIEGMAK